MIRALVKLLAGTSSRGEPLRDVAPALCQFVASYFHHDWRMDGAERGIDVIRHFAVSATPEERRGVLDDIALIRGRQRSEACLERLLKDLGMQYSLRVA